MQRVLWDWRGMAIVTPSVAGVVLLIPFAVALRFVGILPTQTQAGLAKIRVVPNQRFQLAPTPLQTKA